MRRCLFHNSIIGNFVVCQGRIETNFSMVSMVLFLRSNCCGTVASIGNDFLAFISFHCPQHLHCPPCSTDVPVSLSISLTKMGRRVQMFKKFEKRSHIHLELSKLVEFIFVYLVHQLPFKDFFLS